MNRGDYLIAAVEDDPSVAKGLVMSLETAGYRVRHFSEGASFFEALGEGMTPALLLLDIRLPGQNGFVLCRRLREEGARFPVIMLTARDEIRDRIKGLEGGADDYMVKPYSMAELLSRIHARLRRSYGALACEELPGESCFGNSVLNREFMTLKKGGKEVVLTPIEYRLLSFFLKNEGRIFSRKDLLNKVWGGNSLHFGDERTVDVHIRHLREKIEDNPPFPVHLKTIRGEGYCFLSEKS